MDSRKPLLRRMFPNTLNLVLFLAVIGLAFWIIIPVFTSGGYAFNRAQAEIIVEQIQAGKLHPDQQGAVALSPSLITQGWNEEAFVGHRPGLLVFFFTHRVRDDWAGYLYTSHPLTGTAVKGKVWVPIFGGYTALIPSHSVGDHWWYCVHNGHG